MNAPARRGAGAAAGGARSVLPGWMAPLAAAAPWLTVAILFASMVLVSGALVREEGTLFSLPQSSLRDTADVSAAAVAMYSPRGTLLFFDDTRYVLSDDAQTGIFVSQLAARMETSPAATLLVMADERIPGGDLMRIAALAKKGKAGKILFASRSGTGVRSPADGAADAKSPEKEAGE